MDPHPVANLFKRSNYDEPIASELSALDYLYEVLLEIRESQNGDEEIYEVIHDSSLNEKHDCNNFTINFINANCANNMQNPKLGDACFAMSTTYCNDHAWGDNVSYDLENLFKPHDEYICDNIESGFGRVNNPTYFESVQSYDFFYESGFGEVMTLVNDNPTLEECQLRMHVDRVENMFCDRHFVEFSNDPTCNYYERGKYGCRNFYLIKLPLSMLRLFLSSSLRS